MQQAVPHACFDVSYGIPTLGSVAIVCEVTAVGAINVNQPFIYRFEGVDGVSFFRAFKSYACPAGPDAGGFGVIVDIFGEIRAYIYVGAIFNVISGIRGVCFDKGD